MRRVDIDREKTAVAVTLVQFWQAYEQKDLATMSSMLTTASDFVFFGSDAREVITSRREWEDLMKNDWQLFETTKFGIRRHLAIQISDDGTLASAVYEVPDVSLVEGKSVESLDRFAMTVRKENGTWRIVQGMTAVATRGDSSAEIVARRAIPRSES
jgi:SnoaL-like domain